MQTAAKNMTVAVIGSAAVLAATAGVFVAFAMMAPQWMAYPPAALVLWEGFRRLGDVLDRS